VQGIKQSRSQEWLRAGEGDETIKETEETQRRHIGDTEKTQNRALQFTPPKLTVDAISFSSAVQ